MTYEYYECIELNNKNVAIVIFYILFIYLCAQV